MHHCSPPPLTRGLKKYCRASQQVRAAARYRLPADLVSWAGPRSHPRWVPDSSDVPSMLEFCPALHLRRIGDRPQLRIANLCPAELPAAFPTARSCNLTTGEAQFLWCPGSGTAARTGATPRQTDPLRSAIPSFPPQRSTVQDRPACSPACGAGRARHPTNFADVILPSSSLVVRWYAVIVVIVRAFTKVVSQVHFPPIYHV